jgi:glycosyltransferase involved in cell wall biosynthesis
MRGSYYRDGHDCRLCEGRPTPWPAVRHGCYRDSRLQSLPMALAFRLHRADQVAVDRYVALSAPIAESLLASGLVRSDQVVLRPNTVPDPGPTGPPGRGALFVGRLTEEKGVDLLLDAWEQIRTLTPTVPTLTVVGDGPLRALLDDRASRPGSRIVVRGTLDPSGVAEEMRACAVVVVPSRSPEALPLVVLESLAHGRPVLVTRDSGLDAIVDTSLGRAVSATTEDIAAELHDLATADLAEHGAAARERYDRLYSPAVVLAAQLAVYESVMAPRWDRPRSDQAQA